MNNKALYSITYGLYVVCGKNDENINGQIANTMFQISSNPVTMAVSINKNNLTHEYIMAGQAFTVSVLAQDAPLSLIGQFGFKSGREHNKFEGIDYQTTDNGLPYILKNTLSFMEAKVIQTVDVGTHTIFIGEMTDAEVLNTGAPMTYAYYHQLKGGSAKEPIKSTPPKDETLPKQSNDKVYRCQVCGYEYNPSQGDAEHGIEPGTAFEDLPDDWTCPICGVGKDEFEQI
ncbi:flavin reductase [Peptococcaceae bacterium 1198_IL3148]